MANSKHMHQRMNQRGITQRMIEIVSEFGMGDGDKQILDRGNLDLLLKHIDKLRSDFMRLRDKGGLVVVENAGTYITTYRVDSYNRNNFA